MINWQCSRCGSWNQQQDDFCGYCKAKILLEMSQK